MNATKQELLAQAARNDEQSQRSDPLLLSKQLTACRAEVKQAEEECDCAVTRSSRDNRRKALADAMAREERALEACSKAWMAMLAQLDDAKAFEAIGRAACLDAARQWSQTLFRGIVR